MPMNTAFSERSYRVMQSLASRTRALRPSDTRFRVEGRLLLRLEASFTGCQVWGFQISESQACLQGLSALWGINSWAGSKGSMATREGPRGSHTAPERTRSR